MTQEIVQSVDRALMLLEVISSTPEGFTLTEIVQKTDLTKTTALRLINTLLHCGYVRREKGSYRYKLGFKVLTLSTEFQKSLQWKEEAIPFMKQLQEFSKETTNLAVLDKADVVYIERIESTHIIRASFRVGKRLPINCTALGKAMLAFMEPQKVAEIIDDMEFVVCTDKTIDNKEDFLECLKTIRREGYAIDNEENQIGVRCVAAPIFDHNDQVIAALSVSGPIMRISDGYLVQLGHKVKETADNISLHIGRRTK